MSRHAFVMLFAMQTGASLACAHAQVVALPARSDAELSMFLRATAPSVLRAPSARSARENDAVADTLVAIALGRGVRDSSASSRLGYNPAQLAVMELAEAGYGSPAPFAGSTARLLRIAQESREHIVRTDVVFSLGLLADTLGSARALAQLATQPDLSWRVVQRLSLTRGAAGIEQLRLLWLGGQIRDANANEHLANLATAFGWKR